MQEKEICKTKDKKACRRRKKENVGKERLRKKRKKTQKIKNGEKIQPLLGSAIQLMGGRRQ